LGAGFGFVSYGTENLFWGSAFCPQEFDPGDPQGGLFDEGLVSEGPHSFFYFQTQVPVPAILGDI
jgi:hypothetical protein